MNDQIRINQETKRTKALIRVKRVRPVYNPDNIAQYFSNELKQIGMEALMDEDVSVAGILRRIQEMKPGTLILSNDVAGHKTFIVVETEIKLDEYILMRGSKLLATGNEREMYAAALETIQHEYPGQVDKIQPEEVDEQWLKNCCTIYYKESWRIRVVKTI